MERRCNMDQLDCDRVGSQWFRNTSTGKIVTAGRMVVIRSGVGRAVPHYFVAARCTVCKARPERHR